MLTVSRYFIWLLFYSFVGWVYETILCSCLEHRFVKRGFLNGPLCPIYGCGAVLDLLLLGWIENPVLLFFAGVLVTGSLEYFTSWLMEVLFHARWWDYSHMRFHINGRVCLAGLTLFGVMSVALIRWIHPWVTEKTLLIPDFATILIAAVLFAVLIADFVITVRSLLRLNAKLRAFQQKLEASLSQAREQRRAERRERFQKLEEDRLAMRRRIEENLHATVEKMSFQERRMFRSFPHFKSTRYHEGGERVREELTAYIAARKAEKKERKLQKKLEKQRKQK